MGLVIDPAADEVWVDGRKVPSLPARREYIILYKPAGYVTTMKDPYGRPTVSVLVKDAGARVFPVGRLDMDTTGLLLLTNDGELANRLSHPSYGVEKEYLVRVKGQLAADVLRRLERGVELEDGLTAPARVRLVRGGKRNPVVSLTIREGRNRQVRRMLEAVGHPVTGLKRVRYGPLTLAGLKEGEWRRLNSEEVAALGRAPVTKERKVGQLQK
jgi:23S rRNA pseudouridine2605 synthase